MNISIIGVGKIKEKYLKLGIDEFSKRLTKYCKLDVIELDDEKCPENLSEKDMLIVKDKEGKKSTCWFRTSEAWCRRDVL